MQLVHSKAQLEPTGLWSQSPYLQPVHLLPLNCSLGFHLDKKKMNIVVLSLHRGISVINIQLNLTNHTYGYFTWNDYSNQSLILHVTINYHFQIEKNWVVLSFCKIRVSVLSTFKIKHHLFHYHICYSKHIHIPKSPAQNSKASGLHLRVWPWAKSKFTVKSHSKSHQQGWIYYNHSHHFLNTYYVSDALYALAPKFM